MKKKNSIFVLGVFLLGLFMPIIDSAEAVYSSRSNTDNSVAERSKTSIRTMSNRRYAPRNNSRKKIVNTQKSTSTLFVPKKTTFSMALPGGFVLQSDTLDWGKGKLSFVGDKGESLEVKSTANRCDGGGAFVRSCFKDFVELSQKQILSDNLGAFVLKNKDFSWNTSFVNPQKQTKQSTGKYLLIKSGRKYVAQFLFFDPEKEYLWEIFVTSPNRTGALLNTRGSFDKLLFSLFRKDVKKSVKKTRNRSVKTSIRSSLKYRSRKVVESIKGSDYTKFSANKIAFSALIPSEFKMQTDNLDYGSGEAIFHNGSDMIVITALDEVCAQQSRYQKRRCMEAYSGKVKKELRNRGNLILLEERNWQLQLKSTENSSEHVGRWIMMLDGSDRFGSFVFVEPIKNHLWRIDIMTNDASDFLKNTQRLRKFISSLQF